MDAAFSDLTNLRFSNNTCIVGWTSIHAHDWQWRAVRRALEMCPRGDFTETTYVSGDERRMWSDTEQRQAKLYGAPIHILYRGAYFSFPIDEGGGKLLISLGMTAELLRLLASQRKDISVLT